MVLGKLILDDFQLEICTNKPFYLTSALVKDLEIENYFNSIICEDSLTHMKPNPIPLIKTIRELGSSFVKLYSLEIQKRICKLLMLPM